MGRRDEDRESGRGAVSAGPLLRCASRRARAPPPRPGRVPMATVAGRRFRSKGQRQKSRPCQQLPASRDALRDATLPEAGGGGVGGRRASSVQPATRPDPSPDPADSARSRCQGSSPPGKRAARALAPAHGARLGGRPSPDPGPPPLPLKLPPRPRLRGHRRCRRPRSAPSRPGPCPPRPQGLTCTQRPGRRSLERLPAPPPPRAARRRCRGGPAGRKGQPRPVSCAPPSLSGG